MSVTEKAQTFHNEDAARPSVRCPPSHRPRRQDDQRPRKKGYPKPFTNILAVYVDGDMDFSVFDSTTYNISIRPRYKRMDKFCLTFITHHLRFFNCPFQLTVKNY